MRKILPKLAMTLGVLSLMITPALAQNIEQTSMNPAQLLPADIDALYQFNTSEENPLEAWFIANVMPEFIAQEILDKDLAQTILKDTTISIATKTDAEITDTYVVMVKATNDEFKKLSVSEEGTYTIHTENYGQIDIYTSDESSGGAAYIGNFIVVSKNVENLKKVIDLYNNNGGDKLADNDNYQKTQAQWLNQNFFNLYVNSSNSSQNFNELIWKEFFGSMPLDTIFNDDFSTAIKAKLAEGLSLSQQKDGFTFNLSAEADGAVLGKLDMNLNKYNFTPSLYKNVSGKNLILYAEEKNLAGHFQDIMKLLKPDSTFMEEYTTWKKEFKTLSNIDIDKDFIDLFTGNYALFIHNANQMYPAVTLVFDTEGRDLQVAASLEKISDYLKIEFNKIEKDYPGFFTYTTYETGPTTYHEFQLDTGKLFCTDYCSEEDQKIFAQTNFAKIYLRMGTTSNGKMVISTNPDLKNVFQGSTSLTSNKGFAEAFKNAQEEVANIAYVDFQGIENYISNLMKITKASTGDDDWIEQEMHKALNPWHNLYLKTYADKDSAWTKGMLKMDVQALDDLSSELESLLGLGFSRTIYPEEDYHMIEDYTANSTGIFCDVKEGDWYFDAVKELNYQGIMKGYEDKCFRPNNTITRSEFIKILSEARTATRVIVEEGAYQVPGPYFEGDYVEHANPFKDLKESDWYYDDVMHLYNEGALQGFSDDTIRPGKSISRAEAVQMMYNLSTKLQEPHTADEIMPFTDVSSNAWYYKAVFAAWQHKVVKGTTATTFAPDKNLSRGEAAVIILNFINHETSCNCECPCHTDSITTTNDDPTTSAEPSFKPLYFMLPKGITNKTQEITDDQMSISYQTDKNRQTSCEEQAELLVKDGWVAFYETPYDDDYGWSQTFTQGDTSLSLDCTDKDTENTNVELYEYPSPKEY